MKQSIYKYLIIILEGLLIFLLFLPIACTLPHQPGPKPSALIDVDFEPGHNILGILRLDEDTTSSFIYVERAYEISEFDEDSISTLIKDALVLIESDSLSFVFPFMADSVRGNIYVNPDFSPRASETYSLTITSPGLPDLTAQTTIPGKPEIMDESLIVLDDQVSFSINTSPDIDTYDIFLLSASDRLNIRLDNKAPVLQTVLELNKLQGHPERIEIYGYESNLSRYLSSAFTIKPQAYHETVTTVTNGYGCFGALSKTSINLNAIE